MGTLAQHYVSEIAAKNPQKNVACMNGVCITYGELESSSNQLARAFKAKGVTRGDRVSFVLKKSLDSLRVILAILKSDAIYVPLDPTSPAKRLAEIVWDAEPSLVVCNGITKALVETSFSLFDLDQESDYIEDFSNEPVAGENTAADIAYIFYTSGSTGKPKGVMITHANIVNATEWAVQEFGISERDRMSNHPPLHFDLSTFDLYCAFSAGATLFLVPEEISLFPGELMRFIETNKLTVWNSVPSVMVYMSLARMVKPERMPTVGKIFFNGEVFPTKFLIEWMRSFPKKIFVNMYGPTETTVQCTFHMIKDIPNNAAENVPIGKACRNVEVFAIKDDGTQARENESGELYVGGNGVGKGYWKRPELTNAAFVIHPYDPDKGLVYKTGDLVRLRPDGNYEFLGRLDYQVEIMGHRVELGDIEAALYSLPFIKEAGVVTVPEQGSGMLEICAFVSGTSAPSAEDIKSALAQLLPSYMLPRRIIIRDILPRTSTGKIDRVQLKKELQ